MRLQEGSSLESECYLKPSNQVQALFLAFESKGLFPPCKANTFPDMQQAVGVVCIEPQAEKRKLGPSDLRSCGGYRDPKVSTWSQESTSLAAQGTTVQWWANLTPENVNPLMQHTNVSLSFSFP